MFWVILLLGIIGAATGMMVFLLSRLLRFPWLKERRRKKWIAVLLLFLTIGVLCLFFGPVNAAIIILYLGAIWFVCDGIAFLFCRIWKREDSLYFSGYIALGITCLYFCFGWYQAHHVWQTYYTISPEKETNGGLRILQFADSHLGTTFHGDGFRKQIKAMQDCKPDLVVITGDFVDDASSREDMIACCEALGTLETPFGIYYAFGNHDKGYYGAGHRDLTLLIFFSKSIVPSHRFTACYVSL